MTRYWLREGDCLEVVKEIKSDKIKCVITSPPYNIGKQYGKEDSDSKDNYLTWLEEIFVEVRRVSSSLWLNLGYRKLEQGNIPIAYQIWDKVGMYLMQQIIWEYDAGMTYKKRFNCRSEDWLWYVRDKNNYVFNPDSIRDSSLQRGKFDKRNNPNGKLPGTVWFYNRVPGNSSKRFKHPAQFPEKMIERIILACTNENDIVCDPFMGSGTTGVAALNLKRKFVGIEKDSAYFEIAKNRIEETERKLNESS